MITEVQVNIESMAFKGYGVARRDGIVHFIPHAVSGDKAWTKTIDKKKNDFLRINLTAIGQGSN